MAEFLVRFVFEATAIIGRKLARVIGLAFVAGAALASLIFAAL